MYVDSLEIRHVFLACVGPCNWYYKLIQMVGHTCFVLLEAFVVFGLAIRTTLNTGVHSCASGLVIRTI